MKSDQILYTSAEVRKTIIDLFENSKGRRVAITAFVGSGAETYLRKPKGIELICWPKAGGTNPEALRKLIKLGTRVSFVDSLHMKLYWTEDKGAVITSANLSKNALGAGDLKEFGILVASEHIDINKVLKQINPNGDIKNELLKLDKAHQQYYIDHRTKFTPTKPNTYLDWYSIPSPLRSKWKLGYCGGPALFSQKAKEIAREEYNIKEPQTFISGALGVFRKGDWILTFFVNKRNKPIDFEWLYVDYLAKVAKKDKQYDKEAPIQAVQVWPANHYTPPPFKLDNKFQEALRKVIIKKESGANLPVRFTDNMAELIRENY